MFKTINRSQITTFSLMFGIIFLLNLNYTILKSVRKTLAIADLGGDATSIPFFELFGVLPAAIAMTWILSKILKKYSMKKVFLITLFIFIFFFLFFAGVCYPKLLTLNKTIYTEFFTKFCSMAFYVMGELWKPALIQILFLGFINYNLTSNQAKSFYPPLMLGASLGALLAGPVTVFCNSYNFWYFFPLSSSRWTHSLITMMGLVFLSGSITAIFYSKLSKYFSHTEKEYEEERNFSLKEALDFFLKSKSLNFLGWIVFADYIAYSLVEVLFLEVLKQKYPLPYDYCTYMGYLSFAHSILTISLALVIAPLCLKKLKWLHSALILPISLLVIESIFFFFLCSESLSSFIFNLNHEQWLSVLAILGSILFCSCRAIKYTIFDPCKELVFLGMHKSSRMKGKIVIDGLCSKFGKGASSATTLGFVSLSGSLMASSYLTSIVAISIALSLIFSTKVLSNELDKPKLNRI
jgi:AAA family ATP:ADP antiporter